MLRRRLISAFIIISILLLLLRLDFWLGTDGVLGRPGLILCGLGVFMAAMAADELGSMWNQAIGRPHRGAVVFATVAMVLTSFAPVLWKDYPTDCPLGLFGWAMSGIIVGLVITFVFEMWRFGSEAPTTVSEPKSDTTESTLTNETGNSAATNVSDSPVRHFVTDRIARSAFVFVYLNMLFGFLVPHRFLEQNNGLGLIAIITLISTVKLSDSFAYFAGKSFGTIKMAPRLSPGKTVQGCFGAIVGGCIAPAICVFAVAPLIFGQTIDKPWWWFLLYGFLVTCAGMLGDLAESLIKRDADCKDSSSWLPGLGGVLDVIDSLVFAAPVSFMLWLVG